jgi:6-phosphogluconolactonase
MRFDRSDGPLKYEGMSMKIALLFSVFAYAGVAAAGPVVVYVSERGEKRIVCYHLDETQGGLTRKSEAPFPGEPGSLAIGAGAMRLYAAIRTTKQFASLKIDPQTGALTDATLAPAGFNPTYITLDKTGRWLLSASYSEGVTAVSKVLNGVVEGKPVQVVETGKKAHAVQVSPDNRFAFVPHVGELNKVEQFRFDAATGTLGSNNPPYMPGGKGQGPRHFQFHPNGKWAFFVNEQGKSVTLCDYDARRGTMKSRQTVSTVPADWDLSQGSCADIHVSADGRFVYASNRGHDSLAMFAVDRADGSLTSLGQVATVKTPRSFCLTPGDGYVIAAGEDAASLIVYRRDARTGKLNPLETYRCGEGPAWITGVRLP